MNVDGIAQRTVRLVDGVVWLVDQPRLPWTFALAPMRTWQDTAAAIADMTVRGAGAIGATGACAMSQVADAAQDARFAEDIRAGADALRATRPTAQNLFAGIDAVLRAITSAGDPMRARVAARAAAEAFCDHDAESGRKIGEYGRTLIRDGMRISTHCNAGWLAFVDWGSALSPIYAAHRDGLSLHVWVDETRPRGQGARLTAWELQQEGVPHAVLTDGVIGHYMKKGLVDLVIVGSDRIAANGDVANKVGTYASAVLAKRHGIPFYVAAPTTTIDVGCPTGDQIPIEERSQDEVTHVSGLDGDGIVRTVRVVSPGSSAKNPAFDVTPAELVAGIITERGIVPASAEGIARVA